MTTWKKCWSACLGLLLLASNSLHSLDLQADALIGYRRDEITTLINAYDPTEVFLLSDRLEAKHISVYEVGLKGKASILGLTAKGFVTAGRIHNGKYRDRVEGVEISDSYTRAEIYKGHTRDASAAAGYLLSLCNCYAGPIGGWSYHSQEIKIRDAITNRSVNNVLNGLTYKTCWQGPWLGVDAGCSLCNFSVSGGYEYHWAKWRGNWELSGPDVFGGSYSDRRKADHARGQVAYLDINYFFWNCFTIGLEAKYQYWKAKDGEEVPKAGSFEAVGLNDTEVDKIPKATWKSWELQLCVGYHF